MIHVGVQPRSAGSPGVFLGGNASALIPQVDSSRVSNRISPALRKLFAALLLCKRHAEATKLLQALQQAQERERSGEKFVRVRSAGCERTSYGALSPQQCRCLSAWLRGAYGIESGTLRSAQAWKLPTPFAKT